MALIRSFSFALAPSKAQEEAFSQYAGVVRLVYNLALEQRRDFWRQYLRAEGKRISFASQCRELTQLRSEVDWIAAVHTDATTAALRDLDLAFSEFFAGRRAFPHMRSKARAATFRLKGRDARVRKLNAKWSEVRLPGIGWVKYRDTRAFDRMKTITVRASAGRWMMTVATEVAPKASAPAVGVGIDRGISNTYATSTGDLKSLPASILALDGAFRAAQRRLARKVRGSNRFRRQAHRLNGLGAKMARARADWLHGQSLTVARSFSTVALEALRIGNMTASAAGSIAEPAARVAQKRGLNRAILHQGWGIFARQLEYKVEERGGRLVYVNPAYSSQTCSTCGAVDAESRKSQAVFQCVHCGHQEHADIGAAKEILRRGTARLDVEGSRKRPSEASTRGVAA